MRLYTKTGDGGETSLFDGTRVPKDHARVASYGDVDELNAVLGWCRLAVEGSVIAARVHAVQQDLFVAGAELATPPESRAFARLKLLGADDSRRLEGWIDEAVSAAPALRRFILPGGSESAARLHMARTCCRRAERAIVALAHVSSVRQELIVYFNRLSDLLFAWSRQANAEAGVADTEWIPAP